MKRNLFGTINKSAGLNLMESLDGTIKEIGIPPYLYGEAIEIMTAALTTEELDIFLRGFGFNRLRQKQVEIAKALGISEAAVSQKGWKALKKLQASPYRVQLRSLVPTAAELFQEIGKLRQQNDRKELRAVKRQLERAQATLATVEAELNEVEKENHKLGSENESLAKRLEKSEANLAEAIQRTNQLAIEANRANARAEALNETFEAVLETDQQEAKARVDRAHALLTANLRQAEIKSGTLERLGFSENTIQALRRIKCDSLEKLLKMTPRMLRKMAVGAENLTEIQDKLAQSNLALRQ